MGRQAEREGAAKGDRGGRIFPWILFLLASALAVEVVILAWENRRLRKEVEAAEASDGRRRLEVDERLGDMLLEDEERRPVEVRFDGTHARTLLLVFADECPACPVAVDAWREVAPAALAAGCRIVGLQLDHAARDSFESAELPFPVRWLGDLTSVPLRAFMTVPLTAVLDETGTVLWVRYGRIGPDERREIEELVRGGS